HMTANRPERRRSATSRSHRPPNGRPQPPVAASWGRLRRSEDPGLRVFSTGFDLQVTQHSAVMPALTGTIRFGPGYWPPPPHTPGCVRRPRSPNGLSTGEKKQKVEG